MTNFIYKVLRLKHPEDSINEYASAIADEARVYVDKQIGAFDIQSLEDSALTRIHEFTHNKDTINNIRRKTTGVTELLNVGQMNYLLYLKFLKQTHLASCLIHAFSSAAEIMMYIAFIHIADDNLLREFISNNSRETKSKDRKSVYYWTRYIENEALKAILHDYNNMRNIAAHTYQLISIEAAESFILRTYENIQRLELIINPIESGDVS